MNVLGHASLPRTLFCCVFAASLAPLCEGLERPAAAAIPSIMGGQARKEPLFPKYFPKPTGQNGMEEYLAASNADPKPFVWHTSAQAILDKLARCKAIYEIVH